MTRPMTDEFGARLLLEETSCEEEMTWRHVTLCRFVAPRYL